MAVTSECRGQMITPPYVRFPISGPSFSSLNPGRKCRRRNLAYSFVMATIGPARSRREGRMFDQRDWLAMRRRASFRESTSTRPPH